MAFIFSKYNPWSLIQAHLVPPWIGSLFGQKSVKGMNSDRDPLHDTCKHLVNYLRLELSPDTPQISSRCLVSCISNLYTSASSINSQGVNGPEAVFLFQFFFK